MSFFNRLLHQLPIQKTQMKDTDPVKAYNLWSYSYDAQPDNLMLALDEKMFSELLSNTSIENKIVADIGCGTGRHWNKILQQHPKALLGYDVSIGMLNRLRDKFPKAIIRQLKDDHLPELKDAYCDLIISTLTIAHIEHIQDALAEWKRVLKNDGEIIITDYHPEAFSKGSNRTFLYNGQTIAIKNYIHRVDKIIGLLKAYGFEVVTFEEKRIDQSMKHYYEQKNALHVFEKFKNVPIIYGMHLKRKNAFT